MMNIKAEKQREAAYWRERLNILRIINSQLLQQTYNEIVEAFNLAQKDIQRDIDAWLLRFAKNNGIIDLAEARKLLNSDQLKELKWDVNEYIKHGQENAVNQKWIKELENASAKFHISRLEALKIQVQNHLETSFATENKAVESLVKDVYKTGYYRTVYEVQKGVGVGFDILGLDTQKLDTVAHKPWTLDSRTFSDRIWERKDKMVSTLHQEITRCCVYGHSQKEATKALEQYVKKDVKNAKYCASRLIKTETAYFTSVSQLDGLKRMGCEMYEIDLPIDARSCAVCIEMNGKKFKVSEYQVGATAPPFHPNCEQGGILPYFEDDLEVDGEETRELDDDIPYGEWEKGFVKDDSVDIEQKKEYNDSGDGKHYEAYEVKGRKLGVDKNVESDIINNKLCEVTSTKVDAFFLKEGTKHFGDFFDVGYTNLDGDLLKKDISDNFNYEKAVDKTLVDGVEKFSIFMNLGKTKKKRFRTVWQKDTPESKPRIITAHRED